MTPDELRSLADEATPGPWTTEKRQGDVFVCNPPWQGYEGEWVNHADACLIALAPDLARLCAELGEALFQEADCRYDLQFGPCTKRQIKNGEACPTCSALARLSQLKSIT